MLGNTYGCSVPRKSYRPLYHPIRSNEPSVVIAFLELTVHGLFSDQVKMYGQVLPSNPSGSRRIKPFSTSSPVESDSTWHKKTKLEHQCHNAGEEKDRGCN